MNKRGRCSKCHARISRERRRIEIGPVYGEYKYRAKRRGKKFNLTLEQFKKLYRAPCFFCGWSPSKGVDRVHNGHGYVQLNCVPCCKRCNAAKNDMSVSRFAQWVKGTYAHWLTTRRSGS